MPCVMINSAYEQAELEGVQAAAEEELYTLTVNKMSDMGMEDTEENYSIAKELVIEEFKRMKDEV